MRARDLTLGALAAYRLTRLVTTDTITDPLRQAVFDRWPPTLDRARHRWNPTLETLVERPVGTTPRVIRASTVLDCPWCAGIYVAAATTALLRWERSEPVIVSLALATAVGFLAGVDRALT